MYCDLRDKISNFFNKFLEGSLLLCPLIILIALFCILKLFFTIGRACPGSSVPEQYRSHDWALVPASPASKAEY